MTCMTPPRRPSLDIRHAHFSARKQNPGYQENTPDASLSPITPHEQSTKRSFTLTSLASARMNIRDPKIGLTFTLSADESWRISSVDAISAQRKGEKESAVALPERASGLHVDVFGALIHQEKRTCSSGVVSKLSSIANQKGKKSK